MTNIILSTIKWTYENKVITVSEKDVKFDASYKVLSPKGGEKVFNFTHSTGSEFDVNTKWIYKSDDGLELAVCNDANMVKKAADDYLKAKLRKN